MFPNQIDDHLMFKSILYLNQRFFNKIELEEYYVAIGFNFRELYLLIHQYKYSFVKLF